MFLYAVIASQSAIFIESHPHVLDVPNNTLFDVTPLNCASPCMLPVTAVTASMAAAAVR